MKKAMIVIIIIIILSLRVVYYINSTFDIDISIEINNNNATKEISIDEIISNEYIHILLFLLNMFFPFLYIFF